MVIWTPLSHFMHVIYISLGMIGGLKYFYDIRKKQTSNEKWILFGFGIFILGNAIGNIFFYFAHFTYSGVYINSMFIGELNESLSPTHEILGLGHIFTIIGWIGFIFSTEKVIGRTKYILTGLGCLTSAVQLIGFYSSPINYELFFFALFTWIIMFVNLFLLMKESRLEFQNLALIFLISFLIMLTGAALAQSVVKEAWIVPVELSVLLYGIGTLIINIPAFYDVNKLSKRQTKYIILGFIFSTGFAFTIAFTIIAIYFLNPIFTIISIFFIITLTLTAFYLRKKKITQLQQNLSPIQDIGDNKTQDLLSAFSRPQKLTEDEVSIAKEKQICLVCKNKLGGNIFLCSSCGAFYCVKCSDTLSGMENACWVCDAPFDESKPVKLQEKEAEIEVEAQKRGDGK